MRKVKLSSVRLAERERERERERGSKLLVSTVLVVLIGVLSFIFYRSLAPTEAVTTDITVVDNNQTITTTQGVTTITRTSEVRVKDSSATYGYTLSAALNSSLSGAAAVISSNKSSECPTATPCALSDISTTILVTTNDDATQNDGDTTIFEVIITLPASAEIGRYTMDIVYDETANFIPTITSVSPNSGTMEGGTTITITGVNFGTTSMYEYATCGSYQTFTAPVNATYQLDVYGAQGGTAESKSGGKGGYSTGKVNLIAGDTLYVYVGCAGSVNSSGGWNGGGGAVSGTGGGASDVRLIADVDPTNLTSLQSRIIVAGGGAGSGQDYCATGSTGYGGGEIGGGGGSQDSCGTQAGGGTQSAGGGGGVYGSTTGAAGQFGIGGTAINASYDGGGGGGGWYGGGAGASAGYSNAGGGGSGYLFTSTSDKTGYSGNIPNSKYYLSDAATTADVCYGNGIVRITNITNNIVTIDSGGNPANCAITSWSDTKITCVTSPHVVGTFDVTVTNAVGSSPDNGTNDDFTYAYPAQDGAKIQDVTNDTCSTTKTWAYDERDNHTYYIQKIPNSGADGNDKDLCWMLTNLAYIGSEGTVILSDDSITSSYVTTTETGNIPQEYTTPLVHIAPGGISYTAAPTIPSDSGEQYGYLYNWCAAVGAQTSACTDYLTYPSMDATITICPQGWRLPRSMDFQTLNYAVNSGSTASDSGLRSDWLGVYSGYYYYNGLAGQNSTGLYWSSTWYGHYESNANLLRFSSSIAYLVPWGRDVGVAVRCVR